MGRIEPLLERAVALQRLRAAPDERDDFGREFDGVYRAGGKRRMRRHACHIAGKRALSLVRDHDLHIARFADNAHFGPDIETAHLIDETPDPDTSDLFIVRKCQMQRRRETSFHKIRQMCQRNDDKGLHIAGAAPVQASVLFDHREGIGIPALTIHRNHVGVTRQHDPAPVKRPGGGIQIRLAFIVVESQVRANPETLQIVPDPVDQFQIGLAARRIERDERLYHRDGSGIGLHR